MGGGGGFIVFLYTVLQSTEVRRPCSFEQEFEPDGEISSFYIKDSTYGLHGAL